MAENRSTIRLTTRRQGQAPAPNAGRNTEPSSRARRVASQDPGQRSIRLNIKQPPSRLRELKDDSDDDDDDDDETAANKAKNKRQSLGRSSKNKKPIVDESESDAEEDDDAAGDVDVDEEEDDAEAEDDEEEDEDGMDVDEEDDDGDASMQDAPPPPKPTIKLSGPRDTQKPTPTARLKTAGVTPVEDREAEDSLGSELSEEDDEDPEEDPPDLQNMPDDEMGDTIRAEELADSDLDSSDGDAEANAGKNTARRRRDADPESLMALSNEAQKKKFFTAEQISMRRAEMARRRKDLSEKRNEEEKANTLKRLLEKPTPTRRSRAQVLADLEREEFGPGRGASAEAGADGDDGPRAKSIFVRTVSRVDGARVGVPDEWLDKPVGRVFDGAARPSGGSAWDRDPTRSGRMVQVVE